MSHYAIVINELTKRFSAVLAVDCVDLRVKPGELYGCLGLFSVAAGPRQEFLGIYSHVLVVLTGLIGIVAAFHWWRTTDQTR